MDEDLTRQGKPKGPELGSPEAAVLSCVTLMSMLFSQPEKDVAYYLDLYFQVRLAYERAKAASPETPEEEPEKAQPEQETESSDGTDEQPEPEGERGDGVAESTPPRESRLSGFQPYAAEKVAPWTKYKRRVGAQLQEARAAGHTIAEISKASHGTLSESDVMLALNAGKLSRQQWYDLETTLKEIRKADAEEGGTP